LGLAAGLAAGALVMSPAFARAPEHRAELPSVALALLPVEAQATHSRILGGGPFPFPKDGIVFGNRERQLPPKVRGHYREYTVRTPGSHDRGARRIVCGGVPHSRPEACYYTDDHYASFRRIVQ
jgi:ribonuclease T1